MKSDLAEIGCSALIVKTLKEYEDGRSDILTAGQSAFRVIRTHNEKPYMEADVEFLEEDFTGIDRHGFRATRSSSSTNATAFSTKKTRRRFETEGSISLAYHVASELPVDVAFRQTLLEERSEAERQRRLVDAPHRVVSATAEARTRPRQGGGQRPRQV